MKRGLAVDHIDMDGVPAAYARTRVVAILLCGQLQCQRSSAAAGMSACSHEQALSTGLTMWRADHRRIPRLLACCVSAAESRVVRNAPAAQEGRARRAAIPAARVVKSEANPGTVQRAGT